MNNQTLYVAVAVILTALFMLFLFMALNQGNINKLVHITKQYEANQEFLITKCQIDLNELERQGLEQQRCDAWSNLLEQGYVDQNFYDSKNCSKEFDWNGN